jgi:transcriptional regulator with XRE-family HTH domain
MAMNQCDRIKLILQENKLKQKQLASELGVTESYISKLLKDPDIHLSQSLATLIEEKYGYNAEWVLNGSEPKLRQISKNKGLSELHQKALSQLEKMNDEQIKAILAFINSLDDVEKSFSADSKTGE